MRHDEFMGGKFEWFTGIVKVIEDPNGLNRVKVHCLGFYDEVENTDLPWATVMMPTTSASMKGVGGNHHLEIGSWVVGFFRDGPSAQDPIVMGSIATQTDGVKDIPTGSSTTNKVYNSKAGHKIELENKSGDETITVTHAKGAVITIDKDNNLSITNSGNTVLTSTGNIDLTSLANISMTATGNIALNSTGNISADATGPITITSVTKTTVV